jgi:hypothetical protein
MKPDLLASMANDWLGQMFLDMAARYDIADASAQGRALVAVLRHAPNNGKRAILRARDDKYLHPFPILNLDGCKALHLDGHQPDAALHYAKGLPRKGHPDLARRRRPAGQHAGICWASSTSPSSRRTVVRADGADAEARCSPISKPRAAGSAA